jgi:hypothetical protein
VSENPSKKALMFVLFLKKHDISTLVINLFVQKAPGGVSWQKF